MSPTIPLIPELNQHEHGQGGQNLSDPPPTAPTAEHGHSEAREGGHQGDGAAPKQGNEPDDSGQNYLQAIKRMQSIKGAPKPFLIKAILRAVPKLPRKVSHATTDMGITLDEPAVKEEQGSKPKPQRSRSVPPAKGSKGKGGQPVADTSTYAGHVNGKSRGRARSAPPKPSFRLIAEDWPFLFENQFFQALQEWFCRAICRMLSHSSEHMAWDSSLKAKLLSLQRDLYLLCQERGKSS